TVSRDDASARQWREAKERAKEEGLPDHELVKRRLPEPKPLVFQRLQPVRPIQLASQQLRRQPVAKRLLLPGENGVAPEPPSQTRGVAPAVTGRGSP
ncbi:MAG: hypothetical protein ACAI25_18685, partial [Planctomycetota bacterium]